MSIEGLGELHEPHIDDFVNYDMENLAISVSNSVLFILDNSYIYSSLEELRGDEFEVKLLTIINNLRDKGYNFDKIDLSGIMSKEVRREISNIISLNYPSLEISRLLPGEKVVNIQFVGIKDFNDNISKEFTDLFIGKLKDKLVNNFDESVEYLGINGRLIRSNYKHLTFSFDSSEEIKDLIYFQYITVSDLISDIFNSIGEKELLNVSNGLERNEVKDILLDKFLLSTGRGIVKQNKKNSKMLAFYEAEMSSRDEKYKKAECFKEKSHNIRKVRYYSLKLKQIEKTIFEKYAFQIFTLDNSDYNVVIQDKNGVKKINEILLRSVRKGKKVLPKKLELLLMQYLTFLNDGFDFISPSLTSDIDRKKIDDINKSLRTGIIPTKYIEKNYKGTYTPNALESLSKGKKGIKIFIDIVDMGILNINDFKSIADEILDLRKKDIIYSKLLSTGNSVTKKFLDYVFSVIEKYDNVKISLGGDEIFLFLESDSLDKKEVDYLSSTLKDKGLKGRISLSSIEDSVLVGRKNKEKNNVYDMLDNYTAINKIFETRIEKIIADNFLKRHIDIPNNTFLFVNEKNYKYLNNNFTLFLEKLSKNINNGNILSFLKFKLKRKILVAEFDGLKVFLKIDGDNLNILI